MRRIKGVGCIWVVVLAVGALLLAACGSGNIFSDLRCSDRSMDDLARLIKVLPWPIVGETTSPETWMVYEGVEMEDGSVTPDLCGAATATVRADDATVMAGLPDVLRKLGFSSNIESAPSGGGAQQHVAGIDSHGRQLDVSVYPEDASNSFVDAYVDDP